MEGPGDRYSHISHMRPSITSPINILLTITCPDLYAPAPRYTLGVPIYDQYLDKVRQGKFYIVCQTTRRAAKLTSCG